jgi:hypothetical protein
VGLASWSLIIQSGYLFRQENKGQEDREKAYVLAPYFLVVTGLNYQRPSNLPHKMLKKL